MPNIDNPNGVNYRPNTLSHDPPRVKENEQDVPYNPFWVDLSAEHMKLNPDWIQDGIVINWLLKEDDQGFPTRLILGIEATSVPAMRKFLSTSCTEYARRLSDNDLKGLLMLGHPSLASEIRAGSIAVTCAGNSPTKFISDNYAGVIGGELHYLGSRKWGINYSSGRYGLQWQDKSFHGVLRASAILAFKRCTGENVVEIRR